MKFYFAPLVGVTGYVYRNAHHALFDSIDKYFIPFISPNEEGLVKSKELAEVLPENNQGIPVVPQILTNRADYFLKTAKQLSELGYEEVNLNLGCPSAIVVSRGRGAGFLAHKDLLQEFLDEIYAKSSMKISIKTRLGMQDPNEFTDLMKIYNQYPVEELIIHPRVREDFYLNHPNREMFQEAAEMSVNPICYNGDIFTVEDYKAFREQCPDVGRIMMGRGLLGNPNLVGEILTGTRITKEELQALHDRIYHDFKEILTGDSHVLNRMKQFWFYVNPLFTEKELAWQKVKDCKELKAYLSVQEEIFETFEWADK
ncbi:tRNA dihydrouridine synthase B [Lachnospiraceae bacterium KM106-2]|nr:tRNA dihydrouridine synthase B [Lachnospiraceae bacterium KM106-2]